MEENAIDGPEMAKRIGVRPLTIYRYWSGAHIAKPAIRRKIQRITGGNVTLTDWLIQTPLKKTA